MAVKFQGGQAITKMAEPKEQLAQLQKLRVELANVNTALNKMAGDIVALKRMSSNTSAIRQGDVEVFEDILMKAKSRIEDLTNFARRLSNI
jgi:hypothetical protein